MRGVDDEYQYGAVDLSRLTGNKGEVPFQVRFEGRDVLPRRVVGFLSAGAGEYDLLLQGKVLGTS